MSTIKNLGVRILQEKFENLEVLKKLISEYSFNKVSLIAFKDACFFKSDARLYAEIKPYCAPRDFFKELLQAASEQGTKVSAIVVCADNPFLAKEISEIAQISFLDSEKKSICLSNPKVREFFSSLIYDIASRYDIEEVELEALTYGEDFPLIPFFPQYCYCSYCRRIAEERGVSWGMLTKALSELMRELKEFSSLESLYVNTLDYIRHLVKNTCISMWLEARIESILEFVKCVREAIDRAGTGVKLSASLYAPSFSWIFGQNYSLLSELVDSIKSLVCPRELGLMLAKSAEKAASILGAGYEPRVLAFISCQLGLPLPGEAKILAEKGLPYYIVYNEVKKAELLSHNTLVYAELSLDKSVVPKDIEELVKYAVAGGARGIFFRVKDLIPQENLETVKKLKTMFMGE